MSEIIVVYALAVFQNNQTLGHSAREETNAMLFRHLSPHKLLSAAQDCALSNYSMKISYLSLYAKTNRMKFCFYSQ